jgi:hypothetical protein
VARVVLRAAQQGRQDLAVDHLVGRERADVQGGDLAAEAGEGRLGRRRGRHGR